MAKYLKKPLPPEANGLASVVEVDSWWAQKHPALVEFLTLSQWEDGSLRETGTVLLFAEDGVWKACLNDRDAAKVAFVSGTSLEDVLVRAEAGLEEGDLDWRGRKPPPRKK